MEENVPQEKFGWVLRDHTPGKRLGYIRSWCVLYPYVFAASSNKHGYFQLCGNSITINIRSLEVLQLESVRLQMPTLACPPECVRNQVEHGLSELVQHGAEPEGSVGFGCISISL